jgi:hypothetical protein
MVTSSDPVGSSYDSFVEAHKHELDELADLREARAAHAVLKPLDDLAWREGYPYDTKISQRRYERSRSSC